MRESWGLLRVHGLSQEGGGQACLHEITFKYLKISLSKTMKKESILKATVSVIVLTIIILAVTYFSINQKKIIGPLLILTGIISLIPALFYKIPFRLLKSDIIFGLIDNGILVIFAITGAELFGIFGAIVGGAVGNAITDAFAGIFEGLEAQKIRNGQRTALSVAIGKLAGCLLGAGFVLTIGWTILGL